MVEQAKAPARVRLDTERFSLAGLRPESVTEQFCNWLRDPEVTGPLNRPHSGVTLAALRREISTANGITLFYVGIYTRSGTPIGFYMLHRDATHRTLSFNVLVGEKSWWGKGVVLETRTALLDHFFAHRDVDKAIGTPLARNFAAVFNYKKQGWRLEGVLKGQCLAHDRSARLDQFQFGLLAEEWRRLREASQ
jgi:RimJ/RimL family protein N-acetyltransferase